MANEQRGKMIVLFGTNNLGKTTQAKLLVENLIIKMGKQAEYLKYGIYDLEPSGPLIADYLKSGNRYDFSQREFQLLQVLNRTQYEPTLKQKLDKGIWIVAEDYVGTGIAWGMAQGMDKDLLYEINKHLVKEDLGILFKGEPFKEGFDKENVHEKDPALLEKVAVSFEDIQKDFAWHTVNANQERPDVQEEIINIIKSKILTLD